MEADRARTEGTRPAGAKASPSGSFVLANPPGVEGLRGQAGSGLAGDTSAGGPVPRRFHASVDVEATSSRPRPS